MVIALQTAVPPGNEDTVWTMTSNTMQILEELVSEAHDDPLQVGGVIMHCYYITARKAKRTMQMATFPANSFMLLGLLQNIYLQTPDLADNRQRVLSYVVLSSMAGRKDSKREEQASPSELRDVECVRFARFLVIYSRSVKVRYR